MREIETSSTALRAADAFARAAALAPDPAPIRPADPARPRFEVGGRPAQADPQLVRPAARHAANDDLPSQDAVGDRPSSRSQGGLIGALTAFVAKVLGQKSEAEAAQPSTMLAGMRAYAAATGRAQPNLQAVAPEVVAPSLPTLSSGRILDLSI